MGLLNIDTSGHDTISAFNVKVSGYANREVLNNLLEKMWNVNRWKGRFYCGIQQMGYNFRVEVSKGTRKDEINRDTFIKQLSKMLPNAKNKLITIS